MRHALLFSVFVVASCGLAYELISAALASYVLGDSITQFSTVIGTYLVAMGVGSWLSRYIARALVVWFVQVEMLVGLIGGFSAAILFLAFAHVNEAFRLVLYGTVSVTGVLVGLEIPLIMRILRSEIDFRELVAQVLSFDYLGALAVSILFPIVLAPHLGLMRTAFLFGVLNVLVALWAIRLFRETHSGARALQAQGVLALAALASGFAFSDRLTSLAEESIYADQIVYADSTPYQRIVITRWRDDVRLFLNGNLQFSSRDEYRYHEALVHPALATLPQARRVLILGGGDGMAAREVLKYPQVESITLVDLDAKMTGLFRNNRLLADLNRGALASPRLTVVNQDAFVWLDANPEVFDLVLIDFPDPSNYSLGKLYSSAFYRLLEKRLSARGLAVIQATSPFYARKSFWCIVATLEDAGLRTAPYHAYVPSFGEWGYIVAGRGAFALPVSFPVETRYLTTETLKAMFDFPADMARVPVEVNRLNSQILVRYFEDEWRRVMR
ncbi:MAG: polyamine aminopropyltransferase [Betaproteobacteria bacterium]|nr:polyamine aminopropyltransferase [Betaproteobacteria bacterium]